MVETGEIRKRVKAVVAQSRRAAKDRRLGVEVATREGERALRHVVAPMFRAMAGVLKAEGYPFTVSTPTGAVRLAADGPGENFIELALDTVADPPVLCSRVSRARGRRILIDEKVVRAGESIGSMTDEDTLEYLLGELPAFVER